MPHRFFSPAPVSAALVALAFSPALVSPVRAQREQAAERNAAVAAILSDLLATRLVQAQQELAPASPMPAPFSPLSTLAAGLKNMEWRAAQRGPLFAVNPQGTSLWRPKRDPHLPPDVPQPEVPKLGPPDGPRNSYRPETLAPFFGRKLVRCGSVTVFAPTEMTVLATNIKGNADPLAGLRRNEKIKLLQSSFTDGQWKQMGSPTGLGVGEMDATQREVFLSLLPDPFIVTEWTTAKNGGMSTNGGSSKTTLSEGERRQVRLRMNRTTRMTIPSTNDKNGFGGQWVNTQSRAENQKMYRVSQASDYGIPDAFGVLLKDTVPARLKPSQLVWDAPALDGDVDLRGAKTVGDLVARIAKASGLEVVADARVAALPIWVYGTPVPTVAAPMMPPKIVPFNPNGAAPVAAPNDAPAAASAEPAPARAGDVLKALCWAVTGAVRKVGPAYVLTDDLEGIGTRQACISRWTNDGNTRKYQIMEKYDAATRVHEPLKYTDFAADDPAALNAKTTANVEAGWKTMRGRYQGVTQPTSELGEAQKKMVQKAIENYQQMALIDKNARPIVLDKVQISIDTKMVYLLPGGNEADSNLYMGLDSFLPPPMTASWDGKPLPSTDPVQLPPILERGGVAMVSPHTINEVRVVLEAAKEKGLRGLWVAVDGLDGKPLMDSALLKQAVQLGKENGMPVSAVVRLLLAPPASETEAGENNVNITITGETGAQLAAIDARSPEMFPISALYRTLYSPKSDWLRPDAPLVPALLKRRLLQVADTPGLAGIVIRNAAAPGYREKEVQPYSIELGSDFGYTLPNRLACLRATHIDPIDLGTNEEYAQVNLSLPFFMEGQSMNWTDGEMKMDKKVTAPRSAWKAERLEQNVRLLSGLFQSFRAVQPTLPLFIASFDEKNAIIAWEKGDALPISTPYNYNNGDNNVSALGQARKLSKTVLMDILCGYCVAPRYPGSYDDGIVPGSGQAFARVVNQYLAPIKEIKNAAPGSHPTWDGVVLDFGELPAATAADLIKNGMAPFAVKTTANR